MGESGAFALTPDRRKSCKGERGMVAGFRFLKGYLRIRITGGSPERFLNLCVGRRINLWDVQRRNDTFELNLRLKDFYLLRPLARKTGVRVAILERTGLPFFMSDFYKRWAFCGGILAAVFLWWFSAQFIWETAFYGNVQITEDQLKQFLSRHQVETGCLWKNIDIPALEKEIRRQWPVVTWTCVKLNGTTLEVWIRENDMLEPPMEKQTVQATDLISPCRAKVISIVVRSGIPKVKEGDTVEAGQVLVEGLVPVYQEDGSIKNYLEKEADGDIVLQHSLLYEAALPETYLIREYSGRFYRDYFVKAGEKSAVVHHKKEFCRDCSIQVNRMPSLCEKLGIPFCYGEIQHWEYLTVEKKYTPAEAETLLQEKFKIFLAGLAEKGVQIPEKNVRIDKEGDCWLIYGSLTVEEKISGNQAEGTVSDSDSKQ